MLNLRTRSAKHLLQAVDFIVRNFLYEWANRRTRLSRLVGENAARRFVRPSRNGFFAVKGGEDRLGERRDDVPRQYCG